MKPYNFLSLKKISIYLVILLTLGVGGCVPMLISNANKESNDNYNKKYAEILEAHKAYVAQLRKEKNPLGDYYYAQAVNDGIFKSESDLKVDVFELYKKAAENGVNDAWFRMGMMYNGHRDQTPAQFDETWSKRLEYFEKGFQKGCTYREININVYAGGVYRMRYVSAAVEIYTYYRDGFLYAKLADGTFRGEPLLKKDPVKQKYWQDRHEACKQTKEFKSTIY